MVHYWYFFRDLNRPTVESVVYYVKVGTSNRQQTKFTLVKEFCRDCALYFEPISNTSDHSIRQLENSLFSGSNLFARKLRRVTISIDELYDFIYHDSFDSFEKSLAEKKGYSYFRAMVDPTFFLSKKKSKNTFPTASPPRKYLKSSEREELISAIINFGLILAVFLFAAWLEGTAQY